MSPAHADSTASTPIGTRTGSRAGERGVRTAHRSFTKIATNTATAAPASTPKCQSGWPPASDTTRNDGIATIVYAGVDGVNASAFGVGFTARAFSIVSTLGIESGFAKR